MGPADLAVADAVVGATVRCAERLRRAGVGVPVSAVADAVAAVREIDLGRRTELRLALAATLVKRAADLDVFRIVFDQCFPSGTLRDLRPSGAPDDPATGARDELADALVRSDVDALTELAQRLVERHGGLDAPRPSARYHVQRTERAFDLAGAVQRAMRSVRIEGGDRADLPERLARAEIEALLSRFRRELADEVRRRLADVLDEPLASGSVEEIDFLRASTTDQRAMQAAVRPLAHRLAARLASRDRREGRGRVDFRRTIRRSLSTGGVPVDPAYRRRRRSRPDLWLLCDVSGSVADFARFTLAFVAALNTEFPHVRTFIFVDEAEDVTGLFGPRAHDLEGFARLVRASAAHGHRQSDYGRALAGFWSRYGSELGPWSTVLVTGDARTHDRDPRPDIVAAIAGRARRLWFFNPEPRADWDAGDSVATIYGHHCDEMAEVRNLRQLRDRIAALS